MVNRATPGDSLPRTDPPIECERRHADVAMLPILTVAVNGEVDVIASRQRARQIAALCGFGVQDQSRIGTAVSELARNIYNYASGGKVVFSVSDNAPRQQLVIRIEDEGGGIDGLDDILAGRYRSRTGMGLGILSARRLMERCAFDTGSHGTRITLSKTVPPAAPEITAAVIERIVSQLDVLPSNVALSEANQQNRELTDALNNLKLRQEELLQVTQRLEETNCRVEALNCLLDERAVALVSADRRKDEFLAVLSHELRGPLSAASMAAQMLDADPLTSARSTQLAQLITRQVGHMSRLVEDLLDVSRVSRGLVLIEKSPVDLGEVVRDAVEQVGADARKKGHDLVLSIPAAPCIIEGDRTRLIQIVSNLLGNAVRYTPDGGQLAILLERRGGAHCIQVSDNGIGLSAELMPHLFDLYVQADQASDRRAGGLGLGLALVKSLVEAHGGSVSAASEGEGRGSTFVARFPAPSNN